MKKYTSKGLSTILKDFWSISYFYRSFAGALLNISSLSSFYSAFLNIWDALLVLVILYVFQDVWKQDLINITSNYKILMILSSYLMITIDNNIIFRNHVSFNFILKYHFTISLRQFTKIFKQFQNLSRTKENFQTCKPVLFEPLNESKQLWETFFGYCFNKWKLSQKFKIAFRLKTTAYEQIIFSGETYYQIKLPIFPALEINKLTLIGIILWYLDIICFIWLIKLFSSLDITVISNILQEITKILYEKILKAIELYWLKNNASKKNNSLSDRSDKPEINV